MSKFDAKTRSNLLNGLNITIKENLEGNVDYLRNTKLNLNLETKAEWPIRAGLSRDKNSTETVQRDGEFIKRLLDAYGRTKDYVN